MCKDCETCVYYDMGKDEQPCCGCIDGVNYKEGSNEND